jgi:hypothetical protein
MVKSAMKEEPEPKIEAGRQPETPVRLPWHTPKFIVSELACTDAMCNAGNDGRNSNPSLS